jgi:hypothetical protein
MLKIVKDVCEDFHFGQSVQLSSSQKFDLKREHLGALRCACAGERWGARVKGETLGQRQKKIIIFGIRRNMVQIYLSQTFSVAI